MVCDGFSIGLSQKVHSGCINVVKCSPHEGDSVASVVKGGDAAFSGSLASAPRNPIFPRSTHAASSLCDPKTRSRAGPWPGAFHPDRPILSARPQAIGGDDAKVTVLASKGTGMDVDPSAAALAAGALRGEEEEGKSSVEDARAATAFTFTKHTDYVRGLAWCPAAVAQKLGTPSPALLSAGWDRRMHVFHAVPASPAPPLPPADSR